MYDAQNKMENIPPLQKKEKKGEKRTKKSRQKTKKKSVRLCLSLFPIKIVLKVTQKSDNIVSDFTVIPVGELH